MVYELEVAGLARTTSHFMEKLFGCLGTEGRVPPDTMAKHIPTIFFAYNVQCHTGKKINETKAKCLNRDKWIQDNCLV